MIFVQFYTKGVYTDSLIEAVGDRSVIILDGRNSRETHHDIAAEECRKRKYLAYQIRTGKLSSGGTPVTKIVHLFQGELQ